jgi:hypothetical protein
LLSAMIASATLMRNKFATSSSNRRLPNDCPLYHAQSVAVLVCGLFLRARSSEFVNAKAPFRLSFLLINVFWTQSGI